MLRWPTAETLFIEDMCLLIAFTSLCWVYLRGTLTLDDRRSSEYLLSWLSWRHFLIFSENLKIIDRQSSSLNIESSSQKWLASLIFQLSNLVSFCSIDLVASKACWKKSFKLLSCSSFTKLIWLLSLRTRLQNTKVSFLKFSNWRVDTSLRMLNSLGKSTSWLSISPNCFSYLKFINLKLIWFNFNYLRGTTRLHGIIKK